jgi:hypothetical protein
MKIPAALPTPNHAEQVALFRHGVVVGEDGFDPVFFKLGFVVAGELVLFLLVELLEEGEEGTAVVEGAAPGGAAAEDFVEVVVGEEGLVVVGTEV